MVGGWFVPVANLWVPYQVVSDIWQASTPRRPAPGRLIIAWWVLFVATGIIGQVLNRFYLANDITEQGSLNTAYLSPLNAV